VPRYRALLIDPDTRTFTEITVGKDYRDITKAIGCRSFTTGSNPLRGSISEGFEAVYVSDGEIDETERHWFQVDVENDPPSSFPLSGHVDLLDLGKELIEKQQQQQEGT